MIQINLLPEGEKSRSRAGAKPKKPGEGNALVTLFALGVVGLVGAVGWFSWSHIQDAKADYVKLRAEKKTIEKEIASLSPRAQEIREMREIFMNQWEVLQSLDPPNRIIWAEKINMLANLIPSDVFLNEIELKEHVTEVEVQSSIDARTEWEEDGRKGPKPEIVKKPVISYTLRLTGLATGATNVEQFDNVIKFHDALIEHEVVGRDGKTYRFMDNFSSDIEFESVEATLYEGVPVNQFIFKLSSKPVSDEQSAAMQTAGVGNAKPSA